MRLFSVVLLLAMLQVQVCSGQDNGFVSGFLKDEYTGEPLFAVKVTANGQVTRTDEYGKFNLSFPAGTYDIFLNRYGLYEMVIPGTTIVSGDTTQVDTVMRIFPVPVAFVDAEIKDNNTWVEVTWATSGPGISEESLDDGEVDDFFTYNSSGNQVANKFTPYGYGNRHIIGGSIQVGDGTFPGPFLGSQFILRMFDDQGMSGKPGSILTQDTVTVDQYDWIGFDSLDAWCATDNYYLSFYQMLNAPQSAPMGIEMDNPTYPDRSLMKFGENGWDQLFSGNAMIRSWVAQEHDSLEVSNFRVGRFSDFDPYNGNPFQGTLTELATTQNTYYHDYAWAGMPTACYAYGVKILYKNGNHSPWKVAPTVCGWSPVDFGMHISLSGGALAAPIRIRFIAVDFLHEDHERSMSQPGLGNFTIPKGVYLCEISTPGFEMISDTLDIQAPGTFNFILQEICHPVSEVAVDPFTGWMEWEPPHACLYEWHCDTSGNCHGHTLPELDLTGTDDWILNIYYFIQPSYNPVHVEFSTDGGENWEVLYQLLPDDEWRTTDINLGTFSGSGGSSALIIRIRESGNGMTQCLLLDFVRVWSPSLHSQPEYYVLTLDGGLIDSTSFLSYAFQGLVSGQTYRAGIKPVYASCDADTTFVDFTFNPLFAPENLTGYEANDTLYLHWSPPSGEWQKTNCRYPDALTGYRLYYQSGNIDMVLELDDPLDTARNFLRQSCDSAMISVTAVYDLSSFGFPGETAESVPAGPVVFEEYEPLSGEFLEDWLSLDFFANCWTADNLFMSVSPNQGVPGGGFVYISPDIAGYTTSLTSHPLHIQRSPDWQTILEFDLKLSSDYWSGDELLEIQVLPEGISQWSTIQAVNNAFGSFPWQHFTINLDDFFEEDDFRLRFRFTSNGNENANWYLDNIRVYNSCQGPATIDVTMQSQSRVLLTWDTGIVYKEPGISANYRVFRNRDGSVFEPIAETIDARYFDDLETGGRYCYQIMAVYNDNGVICESAASDSTCITMFTGIEEEEAPGIRIFPNPANDMINVQTEIDGIHLEIYNLTGEKIFETDSGVEQTRVDVSGFSNGVYLILIQTLDGNFREILIIR